MQQVCVIKQSLKGSVMLWSIRRKEIAQPEKEPANSLLEEQLFFPGHATLCDVQDVIDLISLIASEGETYYGLAALLIGSGYKTLLGQ